MLFFFLTDSHPTSQAILLSPTALQTKWLQCAPYLLTVKPTLQLLPQCSSATVASDAQTRLIPPPHSPSFHHRFHFVTGTGEAAATSIAGMMEKGRQKVEKVEHRCHGFLFMPPNPTDDHEMPKGCQRNAICCDVMPRKESQICSVPCCEYETLTVKP